ncbi:MAG: hypothetical protein AAFX05_13930 [Planctomycetota bacterium]
MKSTIAIAALLAVAGTASAQDLLAWWSFNNTNNDSDLLNSTGDDNARANFGHMLDNNDAFDDGFYDGNTLLYPVSDGFAINPGLLIANPDPGPGIPNAADYGAAINVANLVGDNFDTGTSNNWGSFSGTGTNRPAGTGTFGGGSLAITGENNNGSSFVIEADLSSFTDIEVSWANRGTSTGFNSRVVDVSTDGSTWTQIYSDAGALSSSWATESASAGNLLDNAATAFIRFTVDGASSTSGNNRFDNIQLVGLPTPGTAALLGLAGLAGMRRRRA